MRVGGAERQVVNTLNHLQAAEKHLLVLSAASDSGLVQNIDSSTVTVHHIPVRLRTLPINVWQIYRFFKRQNINVVHTHMFWATVYGAIAAAIARVSVVVTSEHGMNLWKKKRHRWLERHVLSRCADLRICVSRDILKQRSEQDHIPMSKLRVLPNGTAVGPPRKARPPGSTMRLIAVGRLIDVKGYPVLIEAVKLLTDQGMSVALDILGDGERRASLQLNIDDLALSDKVTLRGNVDNPHSWFDEADMFIMPSHREGQPMALLEAMAGSLPIVASAVGGIPDTVSDGVEALLVAPDDTLSLAAAIRRIINDPAFARRLGENAYARVQKDYSIQAACRKLEAMYQDIYKAKHDVA